MNSVNPNSATSNVSPSTGLETPITTEELAHYDSLVAKGAMLPPVKEWVKERRNPKPVTNVTWLPKTSTGN